MKKYYYNADNGDIGFIDFFHNNKAIAYYCLVNKDWNEFSNKKETIAYLESYDTVFMVNEKYLKLHNIPLYAQKSTTTKKRQHAKKTTKRTVVKKRNNVRIK